MGRKALNCSEQMATLSEDCIIQLKLPQQLLSGPCGEIVFVSFDLQEGSTVVQLHSKKVPNLISGSPRAFLFRVCMSCVGSLWVL